MVTADIGGTHARFALATIEDGRVARLANVAKMRAADHASLQIALQHYAESLDEPLPRAGAIAVAGPVGGEVMRFTNSPWILRPALIPSKLGFERYTLINDFGAVAHALAQLGDDALSHCCGPDEPLPEHGMISVVGPGTGLGVGALYRGGDHYHVLATEGGHTDFAPLDSIEDRVLARLRERFTRVSIERVVAGPGLRAIYETLAALESKPVLEMDDKALWTLALSDEDSLAAAALDRFCLSLGAVAGDIALAQGASAVVIAGGLGARLADRLPQSGFRERFVAKGRFQGMMQAMPVKLFTHEEPGLFGAAAAFVQEHGATP